MLSPSASCGVPVTSTAPMNSTVASIQSPGTNVESAGEFSVKPVTDRGRVPSTLWFTLFTIAWRFAYRSTPNSTTPYSITLPTTLIPSASMSPACTT